MLLIIEIFEWLFEIIAIPGGAVLTFFMFVIVMDKRNKIDSSLSTLTSINEKMKSYYVATKAIAIVYGWIYSVYLLIALFEYYEFGAGILLWLVISAIWIMIRFTITNPNLASIFFPLLSILKLGLFLFHLFDDLSNNFAGSLELENMTIVNLVITCIILAIGILLGVFGGIMWKIMTMNKYQTIKKKSGLRIEPIQANKTYCQICGAKLFPNTEFCGECGTRIVS